MFAPVLSILSRQYIGKTGAFIEFYQHKNRPAKKSGRLWSVYFPAFISCSDGDEHCRYND